ncbi:glutathione peroxidase [Methylosinus sp. Sm6]|uniref:glutathione peroxidase n=1 Tax=Methylosinus sp. Sm6 TaxID=2866948 RepID=UPI001C9952EA|nr:glutathione peroxidase [Methylosinus sp. Sm6]MBY6240522.1 glutathione peroxidase [Methylosinus sp. Sm6]
MTSLYDFEARAIDGTTRALGDYAGKVLLIVNVAGKCGFTPQYAGLEALWRDYRDRGFVVLGFPCNQFAGQEPGAEADIAQFCSATYDVSFPLFSKIEVNGARAHPLYRYLKTAAPGLLGSEAIKWNFTKFLVDRTGAPIRRYAPLAPPSSLAADIEAALAAPA